MIRRALVACLLLVLFAPSESRAADKPEHSFKLAVVVPDSTAWGQVGKEVKKEIEAVSNGRIEVKWYFGAVMGDEPDVVKKMRIGQLQGGGFTLVGLGVMVPPIKILELPFLFNSYEEVDHLLRSMKAPFETLFREKEFELVGWIEVGFIQFYAKGDIQKYSDFRRTKMWTWSGEPLAHAILEAAGIPVIVPLNLPDVYTALQSGIINAFYGPYYPIIAMQWHTQAKSMTRWTFSYSPGAIVVKKSAYDKLPEDLRGPFQAVLDKHLPRLVQRVREDNERSFEVMKEAGARPVVFSDEEMRALRKQTKGIYDRFRDDIYPGWLLDEVLATLAAYRAGSPPSASGTPD